MIELVALVTVALLLGGATFWLHAAAARRSDDAVRQLSTLDATLAGMLSGVVQQLAKLRPELPIPLSTPSAYNPAAQPVRTDAHWASQTKTIAPGAVERIDVGPRRSNCMAVEAIRIEAVALSHPSVEQRVALLSVEVNQAPQFDWCVPGSRSSVGGISSQRFAAPPGCAVPVSLQSGVTGTHLMQPLSVIVRNDNPAPVVVTVELFGVALESLPAPFAPHLGMIAAMWSRATWTVSYERDGKLYVSPSMREDWPPEGVERVRVSVTLHDGREGCCDADRVDDAAVGAFCRAVAPREDGQHGPS